MEKLQKDNFQKKVKKINSQKTKVLFNLVEIPYKRRNEGMQSGKYLKKGYPQNIKTKTSKIKLIIVNYCSR